MPKEKFPNLSNFLVVSLLPTPFNNLASTSFAFSFLNVTLQPMLRPGLIPHVGILFLAFVATECSFVIALSSFIAFSNLSPGSPVPMFNVILSISIFFIFNVLVYHIAVFLQCFVRIIILVFKSHHWLPHPALLGNARKNPNFSNVLPAHQKYNSSRFKLQMLFNLVCCKVNNHRVPNLVAVLVNYDISSINKVKL